MTADRLFSYETYAEAAAEVAAEGDADALVRLVQAYERLEEVPKGALFAAMKELNAREEASRLYESDHAETRRAAVHLMELVPDDSHLPALERAVGDDDERVREQARQALRTQKRSPSWEATVIRVLSGGDREARESAIASLSSRHTEPARAALEARAVREADAELRAAIDRALDS